MKRALGNLLQYLQRRLYTPRIRPEPGTPSIELEEFRRQTELLERKQAQARAWLKETGKELKPIERRREQA